MKIWLGDFSWWGQESKVLAASREQLVKYCHDNWKLHVCFFFELFILFLFGHWQREGLWTSYLMVTLVHLFIKFGIYA